MNHINMINGHINACNDKWLTLESARDRTQDLTEVRCCHRVPNALRCNATLTCVVLHSCTLVFNLQQAVYQL
jgi:hypothetical protein